MPRAAGDKNSAQSREWRGEAEAEAAPDHGGPHMRTSDLIF